MQPLEAAVFATIYPNLNLIPERAFPCRFQWCMCFPFSLKIEMPYKLNPEQYKSVVSLDGEQRCEHFIGRIADWETLWGVRSNDGWLVPAAPEGFEYFPVWPHPEYAQTITDNVFPGHIATEISLADFMTDWLPKLEEDKVKVAVFPNEDWEFWVVEPSDLLIALENEVAQYEE